MASPWLVWLVWLDRVGRASRVGPTGGHGCVRLVACVSADGRLWWRFKCLSGTLDFWLDVNRLARCTDWSAHLISPHRPSLLVALSLHYLHYPRASLGRYTRRCRPLRSPALDPINSRPPAMSDAPGQPGPSTQPPQPQAGPSKAASSWKPQYSESGPGPSLQTYKRHPERAYGGPNPASLSDARTPEQAEQYWKRVRAVEGPPLPRFGRLMGIGGWVLSGSKLAVLS